jgi:hypothetical protein
LLRASIARLILKRPCLPMTTPWIREKLATPVVNGSLVTPECNALTGRGFYVPKNRDYSDHGEALGRSTVATGCAVAVEGIRPWSNDAG